jgi:hypothetical protein
MKKSVTLKKHKTKKHNNTRKKQMKYSIIPSSTPLKIRKITNRVVAKGFNASYSPTINRELVTLKSIPREELGDCNIELAFQLKEPLKIKIPKSSKCVEYNSIDAKKFLLQNLRADKHIIPKNVVPPIQMQSNCWFNAMFVTFFVSDKGRKFFHFCNRNSKSKN